MSESDIRQAMQASMSAEDRRRELASQTPGLGALLPLEQPPGGPGVGISDVPGLGVKGEGYDQVAEISAAVQKAYGPPRPAYADDLVAGFGFQAGRNEAPVRRSIIDPGDGRLLVESAAGAAGPVEVISPQAARPSLLSRLRARIRGRR
jgi:hypothetical protein